MNPTLFTAILLLVFLTPIPVWGAEPCEKSEICQKICSYEDELAKDGCLSLCRQLNCREAEGKQPSSRNDWVIQDLPEGDSSQNSQRTDPIDGDGGFSLPFDRRICSQTDHSTCAEECREFFDLAFRNCEKNCLAGKCRDETELPQAGKGSETADYCVEFESDSCVTLCLKEDSSRQKNCRRDCLSRACPNASASAVAEEALDPGTSSCNRCKKKELDSCKKLCRIQPGAFAEFPARSLTFMACEELCVRSRCGGSCSPF